MAKKAKAIQTNFHLQLHDSKFTFLHGLVHMLMCDPPQVVQLVFFNLQGWKQVYLHCASHFSICFMTNRWWREFKLRLMKTLNPGRSSLYKSGNTWIYVNTNTDTNTNTNTVFHLITGRLDHFMQYSNYIRQEVLRVGDYRLSKVAIV